MATEKPKVKPSRPSIRRKRAAQIIAEKLSKKEKVVMGEVLREAGYSPETARQPTAVTNSSSWEKELNKALKDKKLLTIHNDLLKASTISHYTFPATMDDKVITKTIVDGVPGAKVLNLHRNKNWVRAHFSLPDNGIKFKSLELAYKIGNKMKSGTETPDENQEIREVIFRIRKLLPQAGQ